MKKLILETVILLVLATMFVACAVPITPNGSVPVIGGSSQSTIPNVPTNVVKVYDEANGVVCYIYAGDISCVKINGITGTGQ